MAKEAGLKNFVGYKIILCVFITCLILVGCQTNNVKTKNSMPETNNVKTSDVPGGQNQSVIIENTSQDAKAQAESQNIEGAHDRFNFEYLIKEIGEAIRPVE